MLSRVAFTLVACLVCAGCGTSTMPSLEGRDALGRQIYSVSGDRLATLEATANSECPGTTRPHVKKLVGSGNDMAMTYTCE